MNVLSINPQTKKVEALEIEMQANSVYTFFHSILIDELTTLNEHVIYSDANALSEKKEPYFLGEQLLLGDALIVGRQDFEERDVTIDKEMLSSLLSYDVSEFYLKVLDMLASTDVNLYRTFQVQRGEERFDLTIEWVLYTFNIADRKTQEYFIEGLQKVLSSTQSVEAYMQKMATLAMNVAR